MSRPRTGEPMALHWVKAKQTVTGICDENAVIRTYHAGDMFQVRNQTLKRLLAEAQKMKSS